MKTEIFTSALSQNGIKFSSVIFLFLRTMRTLFIVCLPSTVFAFSVLVEDLDKRQMHIQYQARQSQTLDSDYLHQLLEQKLSEMTQVYRKIALVKPTKKVEIDYILEVKLFQQNDGLWTVQYHCRSPWIENDQSSLLEISYQGLSERYVLYTARSVFDQLISSLFNENTLFEKPLAFVKKNSKKYEIILSDLLFEYENKIYSTENCITQLLWQEKGHQLFWTELTEKGTELKSVNSLNNTGVKTHLISSQISSLVYSAPESSLYFIADINHIPHIYRYQLNHHQIKQITSGPQWIVSLNQYLEKDHLLICSNRSGSIQIYDLNVQKKHFKRVSFDKQHHSAGVKLRSGNILQIIDETEPLLKKNNQYQNIYLKFDENISSIDKINLWPGAQAAFIEVSDDKNKRHHYIFFDGDSQLTPFAQGKKIKFPVLSQENFLAQSLGKNY